jgi:Uma2 family endonuclease
MSVQLIKRQFTIHEYHKMPEAGILKKSERVELIRGEIVKMSPIGRFHAACVNRLVRVLTRELGDRAIVAVQNPVELDDYSEPQPDIALLEPRPDFYASGHPKPADIFLVIEVADSTIKGDREIKIPLYAEDNIREMWLVDINEQCLEVYRQPTSNGYRQIEKFQRGQSLSISGFPDINIQVDEILG